MDAVAQELTSVDTELSLVQRQHELLAELKAKVDTLPMDQRPEMLRAITAILGSTGEDLLAGQAATEEMEERAVELAHSQERASTLAEREVEVAGDLMDILSSNNLDPAQQVELRGIALHVLQHQRERVNLPFVLEKIPLLLDDLSEGRFELSNQDLIASAVTSPLVGLQLAARPALLAQLSATELTLLLVKAGEVVQEAVVCEGKIETLTAAHLSLLKKESPYVFEKIVSAPFRGRVADALAEWASYQEAAK